MPDVSESRLQELLTPYLATYTDALPEALWARLSAYLDLLTRWNARTNLTAVRNPEEMVTRHFGESLFAAARLAPKLKRADDVLDLGSGAGFPGLPLQLLLPHVHVVLAESQGKKAAFLREAVRALGVSSEVWAARAESLPPARSFAAVTLRAVDRMDAMLEVARQRVQPGGWLLELGSARPLSAEEQRGAVEVYALPGRDGSVVRLTPTPA